MRSRPQPDGGHTPPPTHRVADSLTSAATRSAAPRSAGSWPSRRQAWAVRSARAQAVSTRAAARSQRRQVSRPRGARPLAVSAPTSPTFAAAACAAPRAAVAWVAGSMPCTRHACALRMQRATASALDRASASEGPDSSAVSAVHAARGSGGRALRMAAGASTHARAHRQCCTARGGEGPSARISFTCALGSAGVAWYVTKGAGQGVSAASNRHWESLHAP